MAKRFREKNFIQNDLITQFNGDDDALRLDIVCEMKKAISAHLDSYVSSYRVYAFPKVFSPVEKKEAIDLYIFYRALDENFVQHLVESDENSWEFALSSHTTKAFESLVGAKELRNNWMVGFVRSAAGDLWRCGYWTARHFLGKVERDANTLADKMYEQFLSNYGTLKF